MTNMHRKHLAQYLREIAADRDNTNLTAVDGDKLTDAADYLDDPDRTALSDALRAILPYALSRIEDLTEFSPSDPLTVKAAAIYETAAALVGEVVTDDAVHADPVGRD